MTDHKLPSPVDRRKWAEDSFAWFQAYLEVGFTEEQALRIMVASMQKTVVTVEAGASPEASEFMQRMSRFVERANEQ